MAEYRQKQSGVVSEAGNPSIIRGHPEAKVPDGPVKLTVGEVARLTGVTTYTLRHYDEIGLLRPARAGDGVANNRKLYDADDLGRLQAILTLAEYGFDLGEVGAILDGRRDLSEALQEKLADLRRQANRLHDLVLFAKFVAVADGAEADVMEGLACGSATIDTLADVARESPGYEAALAALDGRSDEECAAAWESFDEVSFDLIARDDRRRFSAVCETVARFERWWSAFACPMDDAGYLGFWAIFEDHSLVAEHLEETMDAGDAGFLQMHVFFAWLVRLIEGVGPLFARVAEAAESDVVVALEEAKALVGEIGARLLGSQVARSLDARDAADAAFCVLVWCDNLREDAELCDWLEVEGAPALDEAVLARAMAMVDVLGGEG